MSGDVRLRVEGLMLERLIERAVSEGACFRTVRRDGPRALIAETNASGAAILTALCRRFSLPCRVLSRRGHDAMLRRLKRRATLLAGALTFSAALALFCSRIWIISITPAGGRAADVRALNALLLKLDIRPGIAKSAVETSLLEDTLSAASPELSFVGVRIQGVRLLVEASPAVSAPELYDLSRGRDLVAMCDAVVDSISVLSGAACVKPGDTVMRGQVLIRGDEHITKEESRSIAALGSVTAYTWHEGTASAPLTRTETIRTGRSSTSSELRLMNLSWPRISGKSYASQETASEILPIGGLFLPLEVCRTTAYETRAHSAENNLAELQRQLSLAAFAEAGAKLTQSHPDGCQIADRWIEYTQADGVLYARAVYETKTDIAVTRDTLYQQGG